MSMEVVGSSPTIIKASKSNVCSRLKNKILGSKVRYRRHPIDLNSFPKEK